MTAVEGAQYVNAEWIAKASDAELRATLIEGGPTALVEAAHAELIRRFQIDAIGHLKISPFGMATCCICDAETTHAAEDGGELLPYCRTCIGQLKERFPDTRTYLYVPRAES